MGGHGDLGGGGRGHDGSARLRRDCQTFFGDRPRGPSRDRQCGHGGRHFANARTGGGQIDHGDRQMASAVRTTIPGHRELGLHDVLGDHAEVGGHGGGLGGGDGPRGDLGVQPGDLGPHWDVFRGDL